MPFSKELSHLNNNKAKVCIIGSGAAGLCAIRNLSKHPEFDIEAFEKTNSVGGTWVYNEKREKDEFGLPIHSSMYANLRTNIPLHVMEFFDFGAKNREKFVSHRDVLSYLEAYAKDSDAYRYIKFQHMVKEVKREESNCWRVEVKNLRTGVSFVRYYDVVLVCNGRYSKPSIPSSCDTRKFTGKILHSHNYRRPEEYKDENVLLLGAGPSGLDISLELADHAKKIYLLHMLEKNFKDLPEKIEQINDVVRCAEGSTVYSLKGRKFENIDTLIFATGYEYDYEFLNENVGIKLQPNGKLSNSYLHLINSLYPTMCLLAIPQRILPFPFYDTQIKFYIKYLLGELQLPSKEEMDRLEEEDFNQRLNDGFKAKWSHKMVTEDHLWQYEELLCSQANLPRVCKAKRDCYNSLHQLRTEYASSYKDWQYFELNENEYELK